MFTGGTIWVLTPGHFVKSTSEELSEAYSLIARVCLCLYCAELVCTFYVSGCQVLREWSLGLQRKGLV